MHLVDLFPVEHTEKRYGMQAIYIVMDKAREIIEKYDMRSFDCNSSNVRAKHVCDKNRTVYI